MSNKAVGKFKPYISASKILPETTFKAVILSIILAILMAGSNAYLALKVGMSVSACIPAAVISMAILKMFKTSNILENNIVQTTASAGEAMAAALAFTLPVLIVIGYWNEFPFFLTASITVVGGILGVMLTVPLRRAMVVESDMPFPEGVATAEVLKAGESGSENKGSAANLVIGGAVAAIVKFMVTGLKIITDSVSYWTFMGPTVVGGGAGMSLAIFGAGYIIGFRAAMAIILGAALGWFLGIPLYGLIAGIPLDAGDAYGTAVTIWNTKLRIIGVGAMIVGGLWTVVELWPSLISAVKSSVAATQKIKAEGSNSIPRTERDIPMKYVIGISVLMSLPLYIIVDYLFGNSGIDIGNSHVIISSLAMAFITVILSFVCCSLAAYMTGLIGSSNNPLSGILILAILAMSFAMYLLLGPYIDFDLDAEAAIDAAGIVVVLLAVLGCASAVSTDNMQDLKSGQLLGATPWKQQMMLVVGAVAAGLVLAPILQLLFEAYGFGDVLPRDGMDPTQSLAVPKAALFSGLIQAIFTQTMDWTMIGIGCALAVALIILDKICIAMKSEWRFPVMAVAVGIYLPLDITMPILFGGIVSKLVENSIKAKKLKADPEEIAKRRGTLFSAGMIAGEALIGILLAIPFVAYQSTDVFSIMPESLAPHAGTFGVILTLAIILWFYKRVVSDKHA